MKRRFPSYGLFAALIILIAACSKEFLDPATYRVEPTFAIPLVKASMNVSDIINAKDNEVETVFAFENGADSIFSMKLVYTETLPSMGLPSFEVTPGSGNFATPVTLTLDRQNVYLRMLGKSDNGTFFFTNPTIEFIFDNEIEMAFDLVFSELYTQEKNSGDEFPFSVNAANTPINIDAGTAAGSTQSLFELDNSKTVPINALTEVFEPTPKYLYYVPQVTSEGTTGTLDPADSLRVTTKVHLPLEGLGSVTYSDTLPYSFDTEGFDEAIEFAIMRLNFVNELPLQAEVAGEIFRTDTVGTAVSFNKVGNLPMYAENSEVLETTKVLVPAATPKSFLTSPTTIADSLLSEIRLYADNPRTGVNEIKQLSDGNAIILNLVFQTSDYVNDTEVKVFSEQTMDVSIGIRVRPDLGGDDILDLIDGDSTGSE